MHSRLRRLCEAAGVTGNEAGVRRVLLRELAGHADYMTVDRIGNLVASKGGSPSGENSGAPSASPADAAATGAAPVPGDNGTEQPVPGDNGTASVPVGNGTEQSVPVGNGIEQPVPGDNGAEQPVPVGNGIEQPVPGDNGDVPAPPARVPRVLLAAHMDEVGAIVTGYRDDGYLRFGAVGDIDPRIWPAKRVLIGERRIPGVVGIRSVHMQTAEQRKTSVRPEDLYIDIGAADRDEAMKRVDYGEYVVFDSEYMEFGERSIKAKALDGRAGCALIGDVMEQSPGTPLVAAFTVQEEVGCRGAIVIAQTVDYDLAIDLTMIPCDEASASWRDTDDRSGGSAAAGSRGQIRLGGGPVLMHGSHQNAAAVELAGAAIRLAEAHGIEVQQGVMTRTGYQAEKLQKEDAATPVLLLGIPCRNMHTPAVIVDKEDYAQCADWVRLIVRQVAPGLGRG